MQVLASGEGPRFYGVNAQLHAVLKTEFVTQNMN